MVRRKSNYIFQDPFNRVIPEKNLMQEWKNMKKLCTKAVKKILVKFQTYWYCLTCSQCILHIKYFLSKGSWPQSGLCSLWFFLPSTLPILLPSWSLGGVSVVKTILNWVLTNHRQKNFGFCQLICNSEKNGISSLESMMQR